MAYRRRRTNFRRRRRGRAPWYRRKYNAMQLASAAWRGLRYVKGLVNSELLNVTYNADATPSSSGSIVHLSAIAVGDGSGNRTGNSIFVRKVYGQFNIKQHATAAYTSYRLMVVIDKQQVGDTSPGVTDILEAARVTSFLNPAEYGRFTVLWDKKFQTEDNGRETKMVKFYKNLRHHCRYNGTAASDIQRGGIYLLMLSDQATNTPTVSYDVKFCYHDN